MTQVQNGQPKLLTIPEAAAYLRISVTTMYSWIHLGIAPTYSKVGRRPLFKQADLDAFVAARTVKGT